MSARKTVKQSFKVWLYPASLAVSKRRNVYSAVWPGRKPYPDDGFVRATLTIDPPKKKKDSK